MPEDPTSSENTFGARVKRAYEEIQKGNDPYVTKSAEVPSLNEEPVAEATGLEPEPRWQRFLRLEKLREAAAAGSASISEPSPAATNRPVEAPPVATAPETPPRPLTRKERKAAENERKRQEKEMIRLKKEQLEAHARKELEKTYKAVDKGLDLIIAGGGTIEQKQRAEKDAAEARKKTQEAYAVFNTDAHLAFVGGELFIADARRVIGEQWKEDEELRALSEKYKKAAIDAGERRPDPDEEGDNPIMKIPSASRINDEARRELPHQIDRAKELLDDIARDQKLSLEERTEACLSYLILCKFSDLEALKDEVSYRRLYLDLQTYFGGKLSVDAYKKAAERVINFIGTQGNEGVFESFLHPDQVEVIMPEQFDENTLNQLFDTRRIRIDSALHEKAVCLGGDELYNKAVETYHTLADCEAVPKKVLTRTKTTKIKKKGAKDATIEKKSLIFDGSDENTRVFEQGVLEMTFATRYAIDEGIWNPEERAYFSYGTGLREYTRKRLDAAYVPDDAEGSTPEEKEKIACFRQKKRMHEIVIRGFETPPGKKQGDALYIETGGEHPDHLNVMYDKLSVAVVFLNIEQSRTPPDPNACARWEKKVRDFEKVISNRLDVQERLKREKIPAFSIEALLVSGPVQRIGVIYKEHPGEGVFLRAEEHYVSPKLLDTQSIRLAERLIRTQGSCEISNRELVVLLDNFNFKHDDIEAFLENITPPEVALVALIMELERRYVVYKTDLSRIGTEISLSVTTRPGVTPILDVIQTKKKEAAATTELIREDIIRDAERMIQSGHRLADGDRMLEVVHAFDIDDEDFFRWADQGVLGFTQLLFRLELELNKYRTTILTSLNDREMKVSEEVLAERTKRFWEKFTIHGQLQQNKDTGEFVLKEEGDADGQVAQYLLQAAGIKNAVFKFVKPGQHVPGTTHVDTGYKVGVQLMREKNEKGEWVETIYIDHHGLASGRLTSATDLTYQLLIAQGFLEPTPEFDRLVQFVDQIDNMTFPDQEKYFAISDRCVLYLYRHMQLGQLVRFFSEGRDPRESLSDSDLKRYGLGSLVEGEGKKPYGPAWNQHQIMDQCKVKFEELQKEGCVFYSEKYGCNVMVDLGATPEESFRGGSWGAQAKEYDCSIYIKYNPPSFFISSKVPFKGDFMLGQGVNVRGVMWLKPRGDNTPLEVQLQEILDQFMIPGWEPGGKIEGVIAREEERDRRRALLKLENAERAQGAPLEERASKKMNLSETPPEVMYGKAVAIKLEDARQRLADWEAKYRTASEDLKGEYKKDLDAVEREYKVLRSELTAECLLARLEEDRRLTLERIRAQNANVGGPALWQTCVKAWRWLGDQNLTHKIKFKSDLGFALGKFASLRSVASVGFLGLSFFMPAVGGGLLLGKRLAFSGGASVTLYDALEAGAYARGQDIKFEKRTVLVPGRKGKMKETTVRRVPTDVPTEAILRQIQAIEAKGVIMGSTDVFNRPDYRILKDSLIERLENTQKPEAERIPQVVVITEEVIEQMQRENEEAWHGFERIYYRGEDKTKEKGRGKRKAIAFTAAAIFGGLSLWFGDALAGNEASANAVRKTANASGKIVARVVENRPVNGPANLTPGNAPYQLVVDGRIQPFSPTGFPENEPLPLPSNAPTASDALNATGRPFVFNPDNLGGASLVEATSNIMPDATVSVPGSFVEIMGERDTVWGMLERQLESHLPGFADLPKDGDGEALRTYIIDFFKDEVERQKDSFGLSNIDVVETGTKIDFSSLFEGQVNAEKLQRVLEEAKGLSPEKLQNILKNNEAIREWLLTHKGQPLNLQEALGVGGKGASSVSEIAGTSVPKGAVLERVPLDVYSPTHRYAEAVLGIVKDEMRFEQINKSFSACSLSDQEKFVDVMGRAWDSHVLELTKFGATPEGTEMLDRTFSLFHKVSNFCEAMTAGFHEYMVKETGLRLEDYKTLGGSKVGAFLDRTIDNPGSYGRRVLKLQEIVRGFPDAKTPTNVVLTVDDFLKSKFYLEGDHGILRSATEATASLEVASEAALQEVPEKLALPTSAEILSGTDFENNVVAQGLAKRFVLDMELSYADMEEFGQGAVASTINGGRETIKLFQENFFLTFNQLKGLGLLTDRPDLESGITKTFHNLLNLQNDRIAFLREYLAGLGKISQDELSTLLAMPVKEALKRLGPNDALFVAYIGEALNTIPAHHQSEFINETVDELFNRIIEVSGKDKAMSAVFTDTSTWR